MAARLEQAHQKTVAEVKSFSAKAEEALRLANEALASIRGIASSLLTNWEMIVIVLAVIMAALMLGVGLLAPGLYR